MNYINTNRKKNSLDNTVFSDLCCVCFGSYDEDAGTDRQWCSASAFGEFMRIVLIIKTEVLIVVYVLYAKTVLHLSVFVDMRVRCNCLGKGSCL